MSAPPHLKTARRNYNIISLRIAFHYVLVGIVTLLSIVVPLKSQTQTVIAPDLSGTELLNYIVANYKPSTTLGYDRARDTLYKVIDLKTGNQLTCIYSGYTITLDPALDPSTDAANKGINCEHSWPQSMGAEDEPQRSDMHHLFPVKDNVNSSRSNDPYMEIPDENTDVWYRLNVSQTTKPTSNLEEWAEKENDNQPGFEPRHAKKGDVARASFYFFAMYNAAADTNFWNLEKAALFQWHYADPVDQEEYDRTYRIANYQNGKPNPFVLDSTLARRIWFNNGYSAPTPSILEPGDIAIIGANCTNPDDFAFVCLRDINATTKIYFTDNGWKADNTFRTGEGTVCYTAPTDLAKGTVVVFSRDINNFTYTTNILLSTSGDQILAYQGSTSNPTFIYAINIKGTHAWQSDATDANTSALPRGLTNGVNCVALDEYDNVKYNGSSDWSSKEAALQAISNYQNWGGDNNNRYNFTQISDFSLPVELSSFTAQFRDNAVRLTWITESEIENQGFNLYRKKAGEHYALWKSFTQEPSLRGHGSTADRYIYTYDDQDIQPNTTYYYLLADVDYTGKEQKHYAFEVSVSIPTLNIETSPLFRLDHIYPNPCNAVLNVALELESSLPVTLRLYDLQGRLQAEWQHSNLSAGTYRWQYYLPQLTSGIYWLQCQIGSQLLHKKVIILK